MLSLPPSFFASAEIFCEIIEITMQVTKHLVKRFVGFDIVFMISGKEIGILI